MPKLSPVHWKEFEKFLLHVGCVFKRQESSHRMYWKHGLARPIIIQAKGKVPVFIILNNLRTLGLDRKAFLAIMEKV